ncbi:MAG: ABC transporter ATP-binding protein [Rhodobacteraceae bacterium]|nr:ABC transporter ATP-binding protein [Paracoccaceae bacterium]
MADINIDIEEGGFTCLVGPSGCGKSTLLRIMAGLIAPSHGTCACAASGKRGEIGFVFQDATLMPWASVFENVALPLRLRGQKDAEVDADVNDALKRVGLADFAAEYPRALSGGMRMRASIARAIVTRPRLLLMDEPFAALDEFTRFKLNDDLLSLWQANRWTVVFVTHSIREAVFLGQRLIVMSPRPGRIASEFRIDLPEERKPELRHGHRFADECARVGSAFAEIAGVAS